MINPIPTWGEGGLVLVRLKDSSVVALINQMSKNCSRSTCITSKIEHKNRIHQDKERSYQQCRVSNNKKTQCTQRQQINRPTAVLQTRANRLKVSTILRSTKDPQGRNTSTSYSVIHRNSTL